MGNRDSERLAELIDLACGTMDPEMLASFLCGLDPSLTDRSPMDVLHEGDEEAFCLLKARLQTLCQPVNRSVLPG